MGPSGGWGQSIVSYRYFDAQRLTRVSTVISHLLFGSFLTREKGLQHPTCVCISAAKKVKRLKKEAAEGHLGFARSHEPY